MAPVTLFPFAIELAQISNVTLKRNGSQVIALVMFSERLL
jgi:hypothetical protein